MRMAQARGGKESLTLYAYSTLSHSDFPPFLAMTFFPILVSSLIGGMRTLARQGGSKAMAPLCLLFLRAAS